MLTKGIFKADLLFILHIMHVRILSKMKTFNMLIIQLRAYQT